MKNTKLNINCINIFVMALFATGTVLPAFGANVVQRGRVSASTNSAPGTRGAATRPTVTTNVTTTEPEPDPTPEPTVIADVSSQFTVDTGTSSTSTTDNVLSDAIARQRAALDAQSATSNVTTLAAKMTDGANACDTGLRKCMTEKCGENFANCITDSTTIWGSKMDACRAKTNCTAAEYSAFAPEIRADRDLASAMATYDNILTCGTDYQTCIINQCGQTYSKCLGKSNMDAAIAACKTIATRCTEYDSGLAARTGEVIATIRDGAEKKIAADEQRLYDLREEMRAMCKSLNAMLDERSMTCVYTVEFYADYDDKQTLFASKKAYPGSTFDCTPNWFGIDITTFKENAYRLTRGQVGASSAMLGSGVGTAAGLITSGALSRAVKTQKAEKEVKKAEAEYDAAQNGTLTKEQERAEKKEERKEERAEAREERQTTRATNKTTRQAERANKKNNEDSSRPEQSYTSSNANPINNVTAAKGTPTDNSQKPAIKSVPASTSSGSNSGATK